MRAAAKKCCAVSAESQLVAMIERLPVVVPPFGANRQLAGATALLAVLYVAAVHPLPQDPVSRPTCEGARGAVFGPTRTGPTFALALTLAATFAASLLFYGSGLVRGAARRRAEGTGEQASQRSTVRALSLLLAALALPGAVVALVHASERAVQQAVWLEGESEELLRAKVDDVLDMSEVLVATALGHGFAVGIWSNGWIAAHASVARRGSPLRALRVLLPLASALAAFAPRFRKLQQPDVWGTPGLPARGDLTAVDALALAAEVGLVLVSALSASRMLVTYETAGSFWKRLVSARARGNVGGAALGLRRLGAPAEVEPMLRDSERRDLPSLARLGARAGAFGGAP